MVTSASLERPFAAIIFDWDGTAVVNRQEDATGLARLAETLLTERVWLIVVTGTNFGNIDRQFCRLVTPPARGHLVVCANRGSEVYGFGADGTTLRRFLRVSTPQEEKALTAVAEQVRDTIHAETGLEIGIVYDRLNRRKIDLIPLPEWADPPKSRIGELVQAVETRLHNAGLSGGIAEVIRLTQQAASEHGLQARITSDVKHVEVGLTDKGDAVDWIKRELLRPAGIALTDVLIAGDEFGAIASFAGSDDRLRNDVDGATVISVGAEPGGVPPGVLHLRGGPARFRALLMDQVCLRYETTHPSLSAPGALLQWMGAALEPPPDPSWRLDVDGFIATIEHNVESRLVTGNGLLGMRGSLPLPAKASQPAVFVAGLFDTNSNVSAAPGLPALVAVPDHHRFRLLLDGKDLDIERGTILLLRRWLDFQRGVLVMEWWHCDAEGRSARICLLRFASLQRRALSVQITQIALAQPASMRLMIPPESATSALIPEPITPQLTIWRTAHSARRMARAGNTTISVDAEELHQDIAESDLGQHWTWRAAPGQPATCARLVALSRQESSDDHGAHAVAMLEQASSAGAGRLLAEHARAWAERWAQSDVVIEGDDEAQRAARFALYHLISAANPESEHTSIGARALTGEAYLGHVFWDTELFMLPFYTFTWPAAARALLMYRYHTLPAARAKAARSGYRGALYAWESADTGDEVTPSSIVMPGGRMLPVRNGTEEQHISAGIAYAVWRYWRATGDTAFLVSAGAEIILETARFWASRATLESDARYHIRRVIGPDEYHEGIDDNAYTNEMARWNIERGVETATLLAERWSAQWAELSKRLELTPDELTLWRDVAGGLALDRDAGTGLIEQFSGFSRLEHIDLGSLPSRALPPDVLLGPERIQQSQIIKQADVVMLLALLWDRYAPHEREASFRYYEPRCAHGSSLSPSVHALVAARLGDTTLAERYFHQTAAIDFDDTTGNAALGIHMGALGGLWQSVAFGFAGLGLCSDGLRFEPHLPPSWKALRLPVQWHGRLIRLAVRQPPLALTATLERGEPMALYLSGYRRELCAGQSWTCRWDEANRRWREEVT